jgi:histidinol-phosphatase (PHP family)
MVEMCRSAIDKTIPEIGFTDHFDLILDDPFSGFFKADLWWEEIVRCRDMFQGSLRIRAGVEIGEPHRFQKQVQVLMENYPWDYSLGALHWIDGECVFLNSYFDQPKEQAYSRYFRELQEMVVNADINILAHFDIVKRFGYDIYGEYDSLSWEDEIRSILKECAVRGIALEVNTSTLRRSIGETTPSDMILGWFREEGGQRLVLGSDAHSVEQVGFGLDQALANAKAAGYEHLVSFESMEASLLQIPG